MMSAHTTAVSSQIFTIFKIDAVFEVLMASSKVNIR